MNLIKVKFLKGNTPAGRAYTYCSPVSVAVGDTVNINSSAKGIVTEIDVPETEVASFIDKIKEIVGLAENSLTPDELTKEPEANT